MAFNVEHFAASIMASSEMVVSAAEAIPEDKHAWAPGGLATSTLQIVQHCAVFPDWIIRCIEAKAYQPDGDEMPAVTSLEEAVALLRANNARLVEFASKLTPNALNQHVEFPWETTTVEGTLQYHNWNNTYHLGQLNYLQLILGDPEFHLPG